jgi:branched-chain amino acid transport system substrate-binding protein
MIDLFIQAAQKTGPNLTTDNFIKAMDSMTVAPDMFGAPQLKYTATQHLGSELSRLSQIQDGKWKVISDYVKP